MPATFAFPTRVLFGAGTIRELSAQLSELGASRPALVTDPGLAGTAAFSRVANILGPDAVVFSAVHANPIAEDVHVACEVFRSQSCDAVIAVGGGSAIDVAKLVRLCDQSIRNLKDLASAKPRRKLAPFIAIPTTAGTGSEVGRSSVITISGRKEVIF